MKKGFILPMALLIMALMGGISIVLSKIAEEKTVSLKKQESGYYKKEIIVKLVDDVEGPGTAAEKINIYSVNLSGSQPFVEVKNENGITGNYIKIRVKPDKHADKMWKDAYYQQGYGSIEKLSKTENINGEVVYEGEVEINAAPFIIYFYFSSNGKRSGDVEITIENIQE